MIDAAYGKPSLAVSSSIHPSGCDELMPKTPAYRDPSTGYYTTPQVLITGGTVRSNVDVALVTLSIWAACERLGSCWLTGAVLSLG